MSEIKKKTLKGPFHLENGAVLPELEVAYTILGEPNADQSNVVWICHALTSNSDPMTWWEGMVGPGKFYDPEKHCIICANILGSCYGTTGPLHPEPATGEPWYERFPEVTVRDMVRVHDALRKELGIQRIQSLVGGSLGGQQALEWAVQAPELIDDLVLLSTNAVHSPWGIAFNETQRMAVKADRTYYSRHENGGKKGLSAARAIALLSYRNYDTYEGAQQDPRNVPAGEKKAATYQRYQGEKLVHRFNAFSYVTLTRAMDSHDVGRDRKSVEEALGQVKARTLVVGIRSDLLFPIAEQRFLAQHIPGASLAAIDSRYGHDGFLLEHERITAALEQFYQKNIPKKKIDHEPVT